VAALQRAIALEEMHDITVVVAKNLDLDMAWMGDVFLDQAGEIAECGRSFTLRRRRALP
jgi:hypothetical protein